MMILSSVRLLNLSESGMPSLSIRHPVPKGTSVSVGGFPVAFSHGEGFQEPPGIFRFSLFLLKL